MTHEHTEGANLGYVAGEPEPPAIVYEPAQKERAAQSAFKK